jgi:hypothetical protein
VQRAQDFAASLHQQKVRRTSPQQWAQHLGYEVSPVLQHLQAGPSDAKEPQREGILLFLQCLNSRIAGQ